MPSKLDRGLRDIVIGNRVLAHFGVLDAYGHVSARHPDRPDRFLLSRSRSPELVEVGDIMEFTLDGEPVAGEKRQPYYERFIHGGIYEARPEINAVVHSHAEEVVAFGISDTPLRPVLHSAKYMGTNVPVWDIDEKFGDATDLLVSKTEHGRDLAKRLASNAVVLMRGHGFAAAARSMLELVMIGVYLPRNAQILTDALRIGNRIKYLSEGEVGTGKDPQPERAGSQRAWEYWCRKIGFEYEPGGYV